MNIVISLCLGLAMMGLALLIFAFTIKIKLNEFIEELLQGVAVTIMFMGVLIVGLTLVRFLFYVFTHR